jgi:hypothetical protein
MAFRGLSLAALFSFVLILIAGAASAYTVALPNSGGTASDPIHTEVDLFAADNWSCLVTSFVYDSTSTSLPAGVGPLGPGEMLFAYFLDMENDPTNSSVNNFNVGNPDMFPIHTVGWLGPLSLVPRVDGVPTTDTFQDPYLYGYSGPAAATIWSFYGSFFDPFVTLDWKEYSLVYYKADSEWWQPVPGTMSGGGLSDNQIVPGPGLKPPIPEPSLALGGLIGLAALLKRRRG